MRCVDSDSNKLRMLEVSECRTPRGHIFGRRSPEMERAGGGSIGLHVAFPLEAGIPKGEGLLAGLMRRQPSWGVGGGRKFNQSPEVSVGPIKQLVGRPQDDRDDTIGNILVIYDKVGIRVALICPDCRAKLCAAHRLAPWDSAGRRAPSCATGI